MKRKKITLAQKRTRKDNKMNNPGEKSVYARKKQYCDKHGVWGFEIPLEKKPWR